MHDVYEVAKLLKYSVQIESITAYGNTYYQKLIYYLIIKKYLCVYIVYLLLFINEKYNWCTYFLNKSNDLYI